MKRILFSSVLMLCATSLALGQGLEPPSEPGDADELRGLTNVYVTAFSRDRAVNKKITETIKKKLPQLTFVSTPGDADVWLWLTFEPKYERNRVPPNPNDPGSVQTETTDVLFEASGRMFRVKPDKPLRLIKRFRGRGSERKTLGVDFAKEFVRTYEKANIGLELPKAGITPQTAAAVETPATKQLTAKEINSVEDRRPPTDDIEVLRIDTNLVTINVSVLDRDSRYLSSLSKDIFSVYDEGMKQDLSFFAAVDEPFTVALLIDTSRSVKLKLPNIVSAANSFVDQLRPDDKLMVITFDSDIREIVKTTRSGDVRGQGISVGPGAGSTTLIYDAVAFTIRKRFHQVRGRKAIILLTDGMSDIGESNYKSSIRDAEEAGALIYPIQFDTYKDATQQYTGPMASRMLHAYKVLYERGTAYLEELAQKTGGRVYRADGVGDFSQAFASIVKELSSQYSLGYYPRPLPKHGERRQIKVGVDLPSVAVRARKNYIFTTK